MKSILHMLLISTLNVQALAAGTDTVRIHRHFAFAERNGIQYEIYKKQFNIEHALDESSFTYSLEFPQLDQQQFDLLMEHFHGNKQVKWSQNRRFSLLDFLPSKIQAFANSTLEQNYLPIEFPESFKNPMVRPGESSEYETGMSCWDAVYEVVREGFTDTRSVQQHAYFFHLGARIVDAVMKNADYQDLAGALQLSFTGITDFTNGYFERNQGRQFGDVFMLHTMANNGIGAAHVMMWIDDDFYFEKTDMGSADPFRLVFYDDAMKFWLSDITMSTEHRKRLKGQFLRYNKPLPTPESFTGKGFYYDWLTGTYYEEPKEALPLQYQNRFIWNIDVGLGGGLSKYRINPVYKVEMRVDSRGHARFHAPSIPKESQLKSYTTEEVRTSCSKIF